MNAVQIKPQGAREEELSDVSNPALDHDGGARILVVDDEPALREVVARVLRESGYEVTAAGSGEEATEIFEAERIDLLLTDVMMPGMLGSELVQWVRDRFPETPVIYMSAFSAQAAALASEAPLLGKPFDPESLLRVVRKTLAHHR
jgi:CheY-like chemotaxis protein